jgi:predicted DNA-binding transcriptional regulator YafY
VDRLRDAMEAADAEEIEAAVKTALEEQAAPPDAIKAEAEALVLQRQRDLDAALADAIEVVARHRARLSRKVCSRHDGQTVRQVFELLRGMLENGADGDPSFT